MHDYEGETLFTLQNMALYHTEHQSDGRRHSACLIALRQEIWSVLLYRRPFRLPLACDLDYTQFEAADDFVWANRILVWCADVLRFCFGPDTATSLPPGSVFSRWDAMKAFEENWEAMQPACFRPLYYSPADPTQGVYFPKIWLHNDAQVIGMQHIELGRMLLAVYNPRRQRVGIGSSAMNKAIEYQLRRSILRLCGLALANKGLQAGMTGAAVGISIGGEYFQDPEEQEALIDFLNILDEEHAWPTRGVIDALREAWSLQQNTPISSVLRGPASV